MLPYLVLAVQLAAGERPIERSPGTDLIDWSPVRLMARDDLDRPLGPVTSDSSWTPREDPDSLRLELEIELGGPTDKGPASEQPPMHVGRLSDGRFLIQTIDFRHREVAVYGADGKYVGPLAPAGPGPCEIQTPWSFVIDEHDTVTVFQPGKVTVFDPRLRCIRSNVWAGAALDARSGRLTAERWFGVSQSGSAADSGVIQPLYLTTANRIVRRVGSRGREIHAFAASRDRPGWCWIMSQARHRAPGYEIAAADSTLAVLDRVIRRRPTWWTETDSAGSPRGRARDTTAAASLASHVIDRGGHRLLVVGWKYPTVFSGEVFVEGIDLRRRTVRTARAIQGAPPAGNVFVGGDRVVTYRMDAGDGFVTLQVWRLK